MYIEPSKQLMLHETEKMNLLAYINPCRDRDGTNQYNQNYPTIYIINNHSC
jgi:hypothetical protein